MQRPASLFVSARSAAPRTSLQSAPAGRLNDGAPRSPTSTRKAIHDRPRLLLRPGEPELREGGQAHEVPQGLARPDPRVQQRLSDELSDREGQRGHRGRLRLARGAQPAQAPDQGGHPLRARRQRGRGDGTGRAHDLQVRDRRRAFRRRQGRHQDRPPELLAERARADHAALYLRAHAEELHRPRHRRACARLRHRPARDVVDRRYLLEPRRRQARRDGLRDRQTDPAGRRPRAHRGDRPRRLLRCA